MIFKTKQKLTKFFEGDCDPHEDKNVLFKFAEFTDKVEKLIEYGNSPIRAILIAEDKMELCRDSYYQREILKLAKEYWYYSNQLEEYYENKLKLNNKSLLNMTVLDLAHQLQSDLVDMQLVDGEMNLLEYLNNYVGK